MKIRLLENVKLEGQFRFSGSELDVAEPLAKAFLQAAIAEQLKVVSKESANKEEK